MRPLPLHFKHEKEMMARKGRKLMSLVWTNDEIKLLHVALEYKSAKYKFVAWESRHSKYTDIMLFFRQQYHLLVCALSLPPCMPWFFWSHDGNVAMTSSF